MARFCPGAAASCIGKFSGHMFLLLAIERTSRTKVLLVYESLDDISAIWDLSFASN